MSADVVLHMRDIDKRFGGVHALRQFSFECVKGEVHVLMGENGAGKSTLLKILGGIYHADSGEVYLNGRQVEIANPLVAKALGITVIHQELSLCRNMTVAENIYRGQEPTKPPFNFVDFHRMNRQSQELLDRLNMSLTATTIVSELSIAQMQMVEIAGALSKDASIVVMDEPTASLTEREIKSLFETIATLKERGVTIIYVSHRLNETFVIRKIKAKPLNRIRCHRLEHKFMHTASYIDMRKLKSCRLRLRTERHKQSGNQRKCKRR